MTRQQEEQQVIVLSNHLIIMNTISKTNFRLQIFTAKSLSFKENEVLFLIVDIETTGLNPKTDYIIQLAAKVIGSGSFFSKYIFPPVMLSENIEKMTGITNDFLREGGKDQITGFYHNGRAGAFSDVFDDFCLFCREVSQHHGKPLVMIAHNCVFDLRMINGEIKRKKTIQKNSSETSFPSFSRETGIIAAVDSLTLLRNKQIWKKTAQSLSNRQENVISYPSSYSLEAIYRHLFGTGIQHGHNAVSDVLALERILSSPKLNDWKTLAEKIQLSLVFSSSMVGK
jgi:DNA polymerase III epsilon subunit-like protein